MALEVQRIFVEQNLEHPEFCKALKHLKNISFPCITWAIPAPIKPPPIIVTFLMASRPAVVENALFVNFVQKAMLSSPTALSVGGNFSPVVIHPIH